jgi:hypothetical protein
MKLTISDQYDINIFASQIPLARGVNSSKF